MEAYAPSGYCPRCGYRVDPGRCPECGLDVAKPARVPPSVRRRRRFLIIAASIAATGCLFPAYRYRDYLAVRIVPPGITQWLGKGESSFAQWWAAVWSKQRDDAVAAEETRKDERAAALRQELSGLGEHDWAGEYSARFGVLIIAPASGFVYREYGCMWERSSHGEVLAVADDRIVLRSVPALRAFEIEPRTLIRVHWQGDDFLVPVTESVDFANAVNSRHRLALVPYLQRFGDPTQPEPKWPQLPPPYDRLILREPVPAEVLRVLSASRTREDSVWIRWECRIVLSAGYADGVFTGMEFHREDRARPFPATVHHVNEHDCIADFWDSFSIGEEIDMPRMGTRFSTLSPFAEVAGDAFDLRKFDAVIRDAPTARDERNATGNESANARQSTFGIQEP